MSFVAAPEASTFFQHRGLLFFGEGAVDPARGVDHHGNCPAASSAMGLSLRLERAAPFALSLSKLCLFLFLWVEATQSEPYIMFGACHDFPFMPGLWVMFGDDILSQGVREASSEKVQGSFLIQSISGFSCQSLKRGDIGVQIYSLHADAVQCS